MIAKVYILDDDLIHAKLVAANLGPGRFRTQVFARPDALLAHHAEEPADAIITDLVMPDLDGVEVTRRLRSGDRLETRAQWDQQQGGGQAPQAVENLHEITADP